MSLWKTPLQESAIRPCPCRFCRSLVHPDLMAIALELAKEEPCYEDVASSFWEHFIYIAHAMSHRGHDSMGLWNEEDGFFYDVLKLPDGNQFPMKIRSMVGLIPCSLWKRWNQRFST